MAFYHPIFQGSPVLGSMEESVLNIGVFDEDTRFRSEGGFKKIDRIFQNKLESIVLELNEYLYDDGGRSA